MAAIRVNAARWEELSPKHQSMVVKTLVDQGVLAEGDTIVGDEAMAMVSYPGEKPAAARDATNACVDGCWHAAEMAYAVCVQHGGAHFVCSQAMEMHFKFCVAELCPEVLR